MASSSLLSSIRIHNARTLWNLQNILSCIPDSMWTEEYCQVPLFRHIYHTLHSLDQWLINPERYTHPEFHTQGLNNLDVITDVYLSREQLEEYAVRVCNKITDYMDSLTEEALNSAPEECEETRLQLILAQHRHLNLHLGMLMGFVIAKTGRWPMVLGLRTEVPAEPMPLFY